MCHSLITEIVLTLFLELVADAPHEALQSAHSAAIHSFGKMTSWKCKVNFMKFPSYFMNLPTRVTGVFYQFHEPSKLVLDFFLTNLTCGTPQFYDSGPLLL
jgi:hypothetical protein